MSNTEGSPCSQISCHICLTSSSGSKPWRTDRRACRQTRLSLRRHWTDVSHRRTWQVVAYLGNSHLVYSYHGPAHGPCRSIQSSVKEHLAWQSLAGPPGTRASGTRPSGCSFWVLGQHWPTARSHRRLWVYSNDSSAPHSLGLKVSSVWHLCGFRS